MLTGLTIESLACANSYKSILFKKLR